MRATRRKRSASAAFDDPAWQAMKAIRRHVAHRDAVQESFDLQRQFRNLWSSAFVASPVDLNKLLRTLSLKKVPFVLTEAHAIGGWTGRPRATYDVDILVRAGRNHARAVNIIKALYPTLQLRRFPGLVAFFIPGELESVIDVIYPHRPDLEETLAHAVWVEDSARRLRYRVPALEPALANKYGAMLNPERSLQKKALDVADFGWMVKHAGDPGRQPLDLDWLNRLGEMVWPGGGGEEILRLVEQVRADVPIDLGSLG